MSCVSNAFASVYCCLVVTLKGRADLWLLFVMFIVILLLSQFGNFGQVWYLIGSISVLAVFLYFKYLVGRKINTSRPHQVGSSVVPSEVVFLFLFVVAICNRRYETFVYGRATIHAIPPRLLFILT